MEVSGRKGCDTEDACKFVCKPCEDRDHSMRADGFCIDCEVYMCRSCFDTHKQFRVCRGHTLTKVEEVPMKRGQKEDLEKCDQHSSELIKFYCPQHEQVGCGNCMILEHKSCKIEYIRDKARTFKGSQEFRDLIKGAEKVQLEAKQMLSSVKNNKVQVKDINAKFNQDVNSFKEEMMSYITKLTNDMLKQGEDIKTTNLKSMDALEKENETLMNEISRLTQLLESQTDQPQKLFVSSISEKPKLYRLRRQLDNIKGKNKIEIYGFKRDVNLEHSVKDGKQLGSLQKMKPRKETVEQEEVKPKKTSQVPQVPVPPKPQPLLDRQRICRNITVDGEYLSYADNGSGEVGLYVDKHSIYEGRYFEVEILSMGQRGTIAIGLVPYEYPDNQQLGWGNESIGYHADDGRLYHESGSGVSFGPKCNAGDRIGCGMIRYFGLAVLTGHTDFICNLLYLIDGNPCPWTQGIPNTSTYVILFEDSSGGYVACCFSSFQIIWNRFLDYKVVFTRNGKKIGEIGLPRWSLFPAVGMHSAGEKVKVILDAEMPGM